MAVVRRCCHNTNGVISKINRFRPVDGLHDAAVDLVHESAPVSGMYQETKCQLDSADTGTRAKPECRLAYPDRKILGHFVDHLSGFPGRVGHFIVFDGGQRRCSC